MSQPLIPCQHRWTLPFHIQTTGAWYRAEIWSPQCTFTDPILSSVRSQSKPSYLLPHHHPFNTYRQLYCPPKCSLFQFKHPLFSRPFLIPQALEALANFIRMGFDIWQLFNVSCKRWSPYLYHSFPNQCGLHTLWLPSFWIFCCINVRLFFFFLFSLNILCLLLAKISPSVI